MTSTASLADSRVDVDYVFGSDGYIVHEPSREYKGRSGRLRRWERGYRVAATPARAARTREPSNGNSGVRVVALKAG